MRLIQINGPCGVGKSETARTLHLMLPQSLLINVDAVRTAIPPEEFTYNGQLDTVALMWHANVVGREQARVALAAEHDVLVDAVKYQKSWVRPWERLGHELGAQVLEFCLEAPKEVVIARAERRGYRPGSRLSPAKVSSIYDQVTEYCQSRPDSIIIPTMERSVQQVAESIFRIASDSK